MPGRSKRRRSKGKRKGAQSDQTSAAAPAAGAVPVASVSADVPMLPTPAPATTASPAPPALPGKQASKRQRKRQRRTNGAGGDVASGAGAGAGAGSSASVGAGREVTVGLGRRKLADKVMGCFLVGNTIAQALFTAEEGTRLWESTAGAADSQRCARLLYVGVGDVRNPLSALANLPAGAQSEVHMNDTADVVLARNAVMLAVATGLGTSGAGDIPAAIAMWSDALLSEKVATAVHAALTQLAAGELPAWLKLRAGCSARLVRCWASWLAMTASVTSKRARTTRDATLQADAANAGHGRAGASKLWRLFGVSSVPVSKKALPPKANVTLLHPVSGEFLETQGPAGAFAGLDRLTAGKPRFAEAVQAAWTPLLTSWATRVHAGAVEVHLWLTEGTGLLTGAVTGDSLPTGFHAIDTSNVMDYVGLYVAADCAPCTALCKCEACAVSVCPHSRRITLAICDLSPLQVEPATRRSFAAGHAARA